MIKHDLLDPSFLILVQKTKCVSAVYDKRLGK